jgi:peptidoglycan/LPS O-acetylase OafA/YrhL
MAMGWVILGHCFLYRMSVPIQNFDDLSHTYKQPQTAIIYGAFYAVDTFFWLSGLLMALLFLKELQGRKGRLSGLQWFMVYFHRFWRILPIYMFVLFMTWAYSRYIGDGPIFWTVDDMNNDCKRYWWANLLFINNFVPDWKSEGCLGWAWYLANDMQFYVISPPFLFLYYKLHRAVGWVFSAGLVALHIICCAYVVHYHDLDVVMIAE